MTDANKVSQLISKSLRQEIDPSESNQVREHLQSNSQSRNFAQLSRAIQESVSIAAEEIVAGTVDDAPALSDNAKTRMKESLESVAQERLRLSQAGLLQSGAATESASSTLESVSAPREHQVALRFTHLRPLGEGGLGRVSLVRDERLNRKVALKELKPEALESPRAWQRFRREAEITGMLEHPNIVPIYNFGDDRKTTEPFYTMRFVGKRTLADAIVEYHDLVTACQTDEVALHRLLSIFLDICQAISYAHSRGVVHRDLKPENVALDRFGQVVVLDWGLAKLVDDGEVANKLSPDATLSESSMGRTLTGDIVGTPLYMAPEQAKGDLDAIDELTDVYGLGALLFAILTGMPPHADSISDTQDIRKAIGRIAERDAPRPREKNCSVSSELDAICGKAMSKKPHLRYQSAQQLADAIEKWMAGQSTKRAKYEAVRSEGRELGAQFQSSVADLERNVRFMSRLPPIQELIRCESAEETSVWRDRLATIYQGLLESNLMYRAVVYYQVSGNEFQELVRVERHSRDSSRVRSVPKGRLRRGQTTSYIEDVMLQKPEEVITSIAIDPLVDVDADTNTRIGLVSATPVYDEQVEDVFGVVLIDGNVDGLLKEQLNRDFTCKSLLVTTGSKILMRREIGRAIRDLDDTGAGTLLSPYEAALDSLKTHLEYIDEHDAQIYGHRVQLAPGGAGITYLMHL